MHLESPGDVSRSQIDYIMFNERFKDSVKQAKVYPGADINSDLSPVAVQIKIKLKKQMLSKGTI